ncbi:hypothetical protein C6A37_03690 [Desulfobacteraceae bacterium SEEP-SAG9]|nr:hypothetical protein C6A37_03690 [Desulfobacteraceae bacterium SEEP-SAG9]
MVITCEECNTRFNLDESLLKETGSKVQCTKCKHIFVAYPPTPPEEPEMTSEIIPAPGDEEAQEFETVESDEKLEISGEDEFLKDLDEIEQPEATEKPVLSEETDLSDVEKMLETGLEEETVTELEETEIDLSDLDLTPPEEEAVAELEETEIDLSDLDLEAVTEETITPEDETAELDLDLDLTPPEEEAVAELEETEIDLSDLDIEAETEETAEEVKPEAETTDDLDLSDINKMLEAYDEEAPEKVIDKEPSEPDLSVTPETQDDRIELEAETEAVDELDLSDLDELIDMEETKASEAEAGEEVDELELDLDLESVAEEVPSEAEYEDMELEFDIEEETDEKSLISDIAAPDEAENEEMEFELEESDQEAFATVDAPLAEESEKFFEETVELGVLPTDEATLAKTKTKKEKKHKAIRKKRINKPVLIAAIIIILGTGGYFALTALSNIGIEIQIPYLSNFFKGQVEEGRKIAVVEDTLTYKYIDNAKAGRLFVLTGQVKNGHSEPMSFLRVTGKLLKKGKTPAGTKTVYCGNVLSDINISNMDMNAINERLQKLAGENRSNINVKPDQTVPFMIVFRNPPDDLEEYELEATAPLSSQ